MTALISTLLGLAAFLGLVALLLSRKPKAAGNAEDTDPSVSASSEGTVEKIYTKTYTNGTKFVLPIAALILAVLYYLNYIDVQAAGFWQTLAGIVALLSLLGIAYYLWSHYRGLLLVVVGLLAILIWLFLPDDADVSKEGIREWVTPSRTDTVQQRVMPDPGPLVTSDTFAGQERHRFHRSGEWYAMELDAGESVTFHRHRNACNRWIIATQGSQDNWVKTMEGPATDTFTNQRSHGISLIFARVDVGTVVNYRVHNTEFIVRCQRR